MTDPEDRERESEATDETQYERLREREESERDAAAKRLADDPLPPPDDDE